MGQHIDVVLPCYDGKDAQLRYLCKMRQGMPEPSRARHDCCFTPPMPRCQVHLLLDATAPDLAALTQLDKWERHLVTMDGASFFAWVHVATGYAFL